MQTIKKQWFTLLLMIIQAVMIIFIQPEIGSVGLGNLMFIAIFAEDERNVLLKLAWADKFYFYVQCIADDQYYPKVYYDIWIDRSGRGPQKTILSQCANVGVLCSYSNCI